MIQAGVNDFKIKTNNKSRETLLPSKKKSKKKTTSIQKHKLHSMPKTYNVVLNHGKRKINMGH